MQTIKTTFAGITGSYSVEGEFLPAEPDAGLPCEGADVHTVRAADGRELSIAELATMEGKAERSMQRVLESALVDAWFQLPVGSTTWCGDDDATVSA